MPAASPSLLLRVGAIAVLMAGAAIGGTVPAAAQDRSIVIEDLHAVYDVQRNGAVEVEELYRVRFNGSWNGLQRIVDLRPSTDYPWDTPIGLRMVGATDAAGQELRVETVRDSRYREEVRIYVPDANDRTAELVLRYTLSDVLAFYEPDPDRDYPALDQFYWSVTGTNWENPILEVTAEVMLPGSLQASEAAAYQGGALSEDQVPTIIEGSTVRVSSDETIESGHGLSLGVGWPAGVVERDPSRTIQWGDEPMSLEERLAGDRPGPLTYLPLALPLAIFWFAFRAWDKRGRDPKERAIMVRWEPPEGLSPAEVGTLVDHSPGMHDIISTLVELAVKGYVVIEERDKEGFLKFGTDYVFHLVRSESEWGELARHQERFLQGLFEHRSAGVGSIIKEAIGLEEDASEGAPPEAVASVKLSDLENEFYKEIPDIKDAIFNALVRKGHYLRRPDKARQPWIFGAALMGVVGFAAFTMLVGGDNPVLGVVVVVAAVASAIILVVFGMIMPARTEQGARTREAALGFKQFLEKVEDPRYERMIKSPDQFEKFLPYAMAFECQEQWARAFEDILTEPPDWYHGGHGHFHPTAFASQMGTMASTAGSTMASSPSSSGSGGGGSVGGASGAGGGGGGF